MVSGWCRGFGSRLGLFFMLVGQECQSRKSECELLVIGGGCFLLWCCCARGMCVQGVWGGFVFVLVGCIGFWSSTLGVGGCGFVVVGLYLFVCWFYVVCICMA